MSKNVRLIVMASLTAWAAAPMTAALPAVILCPDPTFITYCLQGDTLRLTGHYSSTKGLDQCYLKVDGQAIREPDPGGVEEDEYSINWDATTVGMHRLEVGYVLGNNTIIWPVTFYASVLSASPLQIEPYSHVAIHDLPLTFSTVNIDSFVPAHVAVYLDNHPLTADHGRVTLPLNLASPGKHHVRIDLVDSSFGHYTYLDDIDVSEGINLEVPSTYVFADPTNRLKLTPSLFPGYVPDHVQYRIWKDGEDPQSHVLQTVDQAPYTSSLDLSKLDTGRYYVQAVATTDRDRATIPVRIDYVNQVADMAVAQAAAAEESKEQEATKQAQMEADLQALKEHEAEDDAHKHMVTALHDGQLSFEIETFRKTFDKQYAATITVTNKSAFAVGPLVPEIVFDDFSTEVMTPEDHAGNIDKTKEIVPKGTETIDFETVEATTDNPTRKPIRVNLVANTIHAPSQVLKP